MMFLGSAHSSDPLAGAVRGSPDPWRHQVQGSSPKRQSSGHLLAPCPSCQQFCQVSYFFTRHSVRGLSCRQGWAEGGWAQRGLCGRRKESERKRTAVQAAGARAACPQQVSLSWGLPCGGSFYPPCYAGPVVWMRPECFRCERTSKSRPYHKTKEWIRPGGWHGGTVV